MESSEPFQSGNCRVIIDNISPGVKNKKEAYVYFSRYGTVEDVRFFSSTIRPNTALLCMSSPHEAYGVLTKANRHAGWEICYAAPVQKTHKQPQLPLQSIWSRNENGALATSPDSCSTLNSSCSEGLVSKLRSKSHERVKFGPVHQSQTRSSSKPRGEGVQELLTYQTSRELDEAFSTPQGSSSGISSQGSPEIFLTARTNAGADPGLGALPVESFSADPTEVPGKYARRTVHSISSRSLPPLQSATDSSGVSSSRVTPFSSSPETIPAPVPCRYDWSDRSLWKERTANGFSPARLRFHQQPHVKSSASPDQFEPLPIRQALSLKHGTTTDLRARVPDSGRFKVILRWLLEAEPAGYFWILDEDVTKEPDDVLRLRRQMNEFYDPAVVQFEKNFRPQKNLPVAVMVDHDGERTWTRGIVEEIQEACVWILLVDLGGYCCTDTSVVSTEMQPLDERFADQPGFAVKAEMSGVPRDRWNLLVMEYLHRIFFEPTGVHRVMVAELERLEVLLLIRVYDTAEHSEQISVTSLLIQSLEILIENKRDVRLACPVYVRLPNTFSKDMPEVYLCDVEEIPEMLALQERIQEEAKKNIPFVFETDICAIALPDLDEEGVATHYRCRVSRMQYGRIKVELIDFGRVLTLSSLDNLVCISEKLQTALCPTMVCRIPRIADLETRRRRLVMLNFSQLVNEVCAYRVLSVNEEREEYEVDIWDPRDMTLIGSQVQPDFPNAVRRMRAKTAGELPMENASTSDQPAGKPGCPEETPKFFPQDLVYERLPEAGGMLTMAPLEMYILDANEFAYLLDEKVYQSPEFKEMVEELNEASAKCPALAGALYVGAVVIAQYFVDARWYRALVLTTEPVVKVFFVDYGNVQVCERPHLLPMDRRWLRVPCVFVHLVDRSFIPAVGKNFLPEDLEEVKKLLADKLCSFYVGDYNPETGSFSGMMHYSSPSGGALLGDELARLKIAEKVV